MKILQEVMPPFFGKTISLIFPKLYVYLKRLKYLNRLKKKGHFNIVSRNINLRNTHKGKRIFIVGTGPSIKKQDLKLLKNEIVISLNEFFLHPDISIIKPKYYLYTGYYIHTETVDYNVAVDWYKLFEECIEKNNGMALLPIGDFDFFKVNNLMQDSIFEKYFFNYVLDPKYINEFEFEKNFLSYFGNNAAVNAIALAFFMGASEICLLGMDHDWILTFKDKKQNHFYEDDESLMYKDHSENFKRNLLYDNLINYVNIFEQYQAFEKYSVKNDVKIINLTEGGLLDVFITKDYRRYLSKKI